MITYIYRCSECKYEYEIEQRITEKPISLCPSCSQQTCERLICEPIVLSTGPQTVGTLAESNRRKMGTYERQEREAEDKASRKAANNYLLDKLKPNQPKTKPFHHTKNRASVAEIQKMDKKAQERYIHEGKK